MRKFGLVLATLAVATLAVATPSYEVADAILVDQSSSGIFTQSWAPDGRHMAYMVGAELYVVDVTNVAATKALLLGVGNSIVSQALAWTPDGNYILFTSNSQVGGVYRLTVSKVAVATGAVTNLVLKPSDLGLADATISVGDPCVVVTATGPVMVVTTINMAASPLVGAGIYAVSIGNDGTVVPGTAVKLINVTDHILLKPSVALGPDGGIGEMVFEEPWTDSERKCWFVASLNNVWAGNALPVTTLTDNTVQEIGTPGKYRSGALLSNDGSLLFYSEDTTGNFRASDPNTMATSDFDMFVVDYHSVVNHAPTPYQISMVGNQAAFSSPPGGTRLAYVDGVVGSSLPGSLYLSTLRVSDTVTLDIDGFVVGDFQLLDGAGTRFLLPPGTRITNLPPGTPSDGTYTYLVITLYTPITPLQEVTNIGITGTVVHRAFLPGGLVFTQYGPGVASGYFKYTDLEIAAVPDESALQLYEINSNNLLTNVTIITRDLTNNQIVGQITGFSSYVIALPSGTDTDGDGLSDDDETNVYNTNTNAADSDGDGRTDYQEVWFDGNGAYNPYNPITNPTGTDTDANDGDTDDDGVNDGMESNLGSNPLDANDTVSVPAAAPLGYGILTILILLAGAYYTRQNLTKTA